VLHLVFGETRPSLSNFKKWIMDQKTILIAEDEIVVSLDLKMLLKHHGYCVRKAVSTGEELISEYNLEKPDLVILDLKLKGKLNGIQIIDEIRKIGSTPIVIVSSTLKSTLKKIALGFSNIKVISKPFEHEDLLEAINSFFCEN
jgi:DNA-binding response OmpR family regulator